MQTTIRSLTLLLAGNLWVGSVMAQSSAFNNTVKLGVARYTTHSQSNGVTGIGIPPGADAETGNATTLLFTYERAITPEIGVELDLGVPPKIPAQAKGSVAFLGEVLTARNVSPTFFVNYHFGQSGDIPDLYREYGLDENTILDACAQALLTL